MRHEDTPAEVVELSDAELDGVVAGKGPVYVGRPGWGGWGGGWGWGWGGPRWGGGYPYGPRPVARAAVRRAVWGPRWW